MKIEINARVWLVAAVALLVAGCATATPDSKYRIPKERASDRLQQMEQWMAGDFEPSELAEANRDEIQSVAGSGKKSAAPEAVGGRIIRDVTAAEMLFWSGDIERAFELYARVLRLDATHPLARFSASRLYQLRNRLVDYRQRMSKLLDDLSYKEVGPLTRVDLSLAAQTVAYRNWEQSVSSEPFRGDELGFPTRWRITPTMSPWPRLDIEKAFPPEKAPSLAEKYLSPWFAEKDQQNRERVRSYNSDGLSLSPNFRSDGIYYLETFATVKPVDHAGDGESAAGSALDGRHYWLYGSFSGAATVWIDGERVLSRRMESYGTSKRLRRIRLKPGTYRVLVKLGFESGYRDWFDLAFLGDTSRPLGGSGISFSRKPPADKRDPARYSDGSGIERISSQHRPSVLERLRLPAAAISQKTDPITLYWTAVAGVLEHQPDVFEPAFSALMKRFPEFAAGHAIKAQQVRTLWELPIDRRRAISTSRLKRAHQADPENVYFLTQLVEVLRRQGASDERIRRHLRLARQAAFTGDGSVIRKEGSGPNGSILLPEERRGRLKTIEPLTAWASWLTNKGWSAEAEDAWRAVLELEPGSCRAASELQSLWYDRSYFPGLDEISSRHESCSSLKWRRAQHLRRKKVAAYRMHYLRRHARRNPFDAGRQIAYADELWERGDKEKARQILEKARRRTPNSTALWRELAEYEFAAHEDIEAGRKAATRMLLEGLRRVGSSTGLLRKLAWLDRDTPLTSYLRDGREVVREHMRTDKKVRGPGGDDAAYFVLDFAVRKYFPDGGSLTLTHTITRVMTKGAIDRVGEQQIPSNEYLLRARAINPDGTVDIPQQTSGKSTLSMPGLDEGDFVELAWVSYSPPSWISDTHLEDMRFFFRMPDISSMHSEYVILGPKDMKFIRRNGPPEAKQVKRTSEHRVFPAEYGAQQGVQFLEKGSSRPRREPYSVDANEFLPWVQMYRRGVTIAPFEIRRRRTRDVLSRSLQTSDPLEEKVSEWRAGTPPKSMAGIKQLFYRVTDHVTDGDYLNFSRAASHVAVTAEGSRLVLLKAAYDTVGVDSDIFMVKSKYQPPTVLPIGENHRYQRAALRIETPAGVKWVVPNQRDAMFGAVPVGSVGQPAVCVTCAKGGDEVIRTSLPADGFRENTRDVKIRASLDREGTLEGTATITLHGVRAGSVRNTLRQRPDASRRRSLFDSIASSVLPGASLENYEIKNEKNDDKPLVLRMKFKRSMFARPTANSDGEKSWQIQTSIFENALASRYASLAQRQRPLMIGRQLNNEQSLVIELADGMSAEITSQKGSWSYDSSFGEFQRTVVAKDEKIRVTNRLHLPIQRVSTERYGKFQQWAANVEGSGRLEASIHSQTR